MKLIDGLNVITSLAVLGMAAYVAAGPVARRVARYKAERVERRTIARLWDELATGAGGGAGPGDVVLVEFSDYECPFCRQAHGRLTALREEYPHLWIVYHHLPLPIHPQAEPAARAAICADVQDQFEVMHEWLFETSNWQVAPDWRAIARTVKVHDVERFLACLRSHATDDQLARDRRLAAELGISGTPTFVRRSGIVKGFGDGLVGELRGALAGR